MLRTQPARSALAEPWFEACNENRLLIQRCRACGHLQFYPRIVCSSCVSDELEWIEASGLGVVTSFTVVRRAVSEAYEAPYVVALVELAEGPTMMTNIVDCDPEELRVGASVRAGFERWDDNVSLPVFSLVEK